MSSKKDTSASASNEVNTSSSTTKKSNTSSSASNKLSTTQHVSSKMKGADFPKVSHRELYEIFHDKGLTIGTSTDNRLELQRFIMSKASDGFPEEVVEEKVRQFIYPLSAKWKECHRNKARFLEKYSKWLERPLFNPEKKITITPKKSSFDKKFNPEGKQTTERKGKGRGRPEKIFSICSPKTKKRRIRPLLQNSTIEELEIAVTFALRADGKRDAAKVVEGAMNGSPETLRKMKRVCFPDENEEAETKVRMYTPEEALKLITDLKLSKRQYISLYKGAKERNAKLYPPYYLVLLAKEQGVPGSGDAANVDSKGGLIENAADKQKDGEEGAPGRTTEGNMGGAGAGIGPKTAKRGPHMGPKAVVAPPPHPLSVQERPLMDCRMDTSQMAQMRQVPQLPQVPQVPQVLQVPHAPPVSLAPPTAHPPQLSHVPQVSLASQMTHATQVSHTAVHSAVHTAAHTAAHTVVHTAAHAAAHAAGHTASHVASHAQQVSHVPQVSHASHASQVSHAAPHVSQMSHLVQMQQYSGWPF